MAATDEIDTILDPNSSETDNIHQILRFAVAISVTQESQSTSVDEDKVGLFPQKTFTFGDFERRVYCSVTGVKVRLIQTAEGTGVAYLTFTQDCGSKRSETISGWDWHFSVDLYDKNKAFIRNVYLGTWDHRCNRHLVELRENFSWVIGSINPVDNAAEAVLHWQYKTRVNGGC